MLREKELLREKSALEIQNKAKAIEINNINYLKKRESGLRAEINGALEKEFYQKLEDKEKQIRKGLEDEFNKKLSERESQIKEQAQKEIETKKHELKEEVEESIKHVLDEK